MKNDWEAKKVVKSKDSVWVKFGRQNRMDPEAGAMLFSGSVLALLVINVFGIQDGLWIFLIWLFFMLANIFLFWPMFLTSLVVAGVTLTYIIINVITKMN